MQIKIKTNAVEIYSQIKQIGDTCSPEDVEPLQFIRDTIWKRVFVHSKIWNDELEVSRYSKSAKFILPIDCFDLSEEEENPSIFLKVMRILTRYKYFFLMLLIIPSFVFLAWFSDGNNSKINALTEKEMLNIKKIWAKFETQKILKKQLNDTQMEITKNIKEVKALELDNAHIREKIINETERF